MDKPLTYQPSQPSKIMKLFWKAAGGDAFILSQATYSDQIKYFCLGGIVVATAIMAGLSGGYAFYTIFRPKDITENQYVETGFTSANQVIENTSAIQEVTDIPTVLTAILFGIIWGLIIYNIDRFIVTSTGKGDGTEAITWGELKGALPRLIMGIIIAVSISKPLEIRILKGEIDRHLSSIQKDFYKNEIEKVKETDKATLVQLDSDIASYKQRLNEYQDDYDRLQEKIEYENSNGGCRGKCDEFKRQQAKIQEKINEIKGDLSYQSLLDERKNLLADEKDKFKDIEKEAKLLDGLAIRIGLAEEEYPAVSWFLTLLFLAIELTPIFFKLMLIKSPYDYMSDNYKQLELAENGIYVEEDYYEDKEGVQRELVRYLAAEKHINEKKEFLDAQLRITKYAIEKFEEQEKKKIDENPESFITYES
ncbi:DUF4407 domain-containing protein [Leeuwenhoekiella marinoflava]|uniref:DUF4407 domain-containing protein n=3 Tax=Leeuwenhoekiella marinoflava TaxID=988 RepID=A0A4Q0PLE2_9FLAO|nr:DUF4407 domain-containing protein [Leeuwenhoekiella marinoflava]RXG29871.1 putative protein DUF4407 [Leeuwenhoekiella marinoflava]SHF27721.1 protein of unknown function [Leeuwenhoekiella marinoflava DSM 3653]